MTHKDHIINILREVHTGGPNPGEGIKDYLDRMANMVLSYVPKDEEDDSVKVKTKK